MSIDDEGEDWVLDPTGFINKANITFTSNFFWVLVHHQLSPTAADDNLTLNRAILAEVLIAYLEIDFAKLLILMIHEMYL